MIQLFSFFSFYCLTFVAFSLYVTDSSSDADNDSDDDASDNDDEQEGANSGLIDAVRADKGDFFGYIDETGNVVYINMNDEGEGEGEESGMEVTDGAAVTAAGNV